MRGGRAAADTGRAIGIERYADARRRVIVGDPRLAVSYDEVVTAAALEFVEEAIGVAGDPASDIRTRRSEAGRIEGIVVLLPVTSSMDRSVSVLITCGSGSLLVSKTVPIARATKTGPALPP